MSIQVGHQAPDFALHASDKSKIALSELKGKNVLLLFFPLAFTSTCTKELCAIRDDIGRYSNAKAHVLGISVDSVYALAKYKEEQGYNFPLLSDFNKEVSKAYGSLYDEWILDMKGVAKRSAFVIDKEGVVQYAEVLENASDLPDFQSINQLLSDLN